MRDSSEIDNEKRKGWRLFAVAWSVGATGSHRLWARNEEHAKELSNELFMPTAENTEFGDADEIIDVVQMDEEEEPLTDENRPELTIKERNR